ncbi:hypothetical protein A2643_04055 [Candidatus Nomurabacteria bacterium RIFCSPHIGHO2_01_FULL_39_220]|uniref:Oxidized purine nucleoside triphosphate hydrolase n=1 Tax=Candidatus Nomurabacteria bacterium RIFCSPLOWO2_02_FULL_40_67 TaxID=1801787 RepID=A0A1F6Y5N4_9BACT|nr:MAG: hypothetical protein UU01_C0004G0062 [Parcubacteria group bacterium GW2011_GWA2_40_37]KKS10837.1 MAG: hypothetical protein UU66_C0040G0008 [Parcubacteria group bacterium GW2011_GWB1_41_5]KKS71024.1 MAG: hypothetical protein UV43_C0046G0004 [Parcubacteria group bacterium GW2011_GWF2_42_7]OGI62849.1 MAG: hypothetical protein A2W12_03625 [Candidatus Nomurabacteria bacterium RBG_16_40_11]OGI69776.1 MAG: hypothetical protein A2643_04055 [Candidatus Nomurabacteria bacterium RIFCSPHIGHO2_01_FU
MKKSVSRQTVCVIRKDNQILLAKKTRKLGKGFWNGPGGKVEVGESLEACAIRETQEESGLEIKNLITVGVITFEFKDKSQSVLLHIFLVDDFAGEVVETDQMEEWKWFDVDKLPFQDMWADDELWLPKVLEGKKIMGKIVFDHPSTKENVGKIIESNLENVTELIQEKNSELKPQIKIK